MKSRSLKKSGKIVTLSFVIPIKYHFINIRGFSSNSLIYDAKFFVWKQNLIFMCFFPLSCLLHNEMVDDIVSSIDTTRG